MAKREIELGDLVVDKISGYKGVVNSIAKCLTGCDRADVTPNKLDKDGKIPTGYWFDLYQLKIIKKGVVKPSAVQEPIKKIGRKDGGPPTISRGTR